MRPANSGVERQVESIVRVLRERRARAQTRRFQQRGPTPTEGRDEQATVLQVITSLRTDGTTSTLG